ncbi:MAG: NifB/NifX family molybdenum-iron cluster-binding protein [Granulosicoccaceae bacterium]
MYITSGQGWNDSCWEYGGIDLDSRPDRLLKQSLVVESMMSDLAEVDSVADVAADESVLMVAFATSDGESVNQHFGSARGFHVFGVAGNAAPLLATKSFPKEKKDGNEDKLKPKLAWLHGCDLVYCGSVGGSATKQLITLGAHPIVVKGGPEIEEIIEELQEELNGTLSPMLERVIKQKTVKTDDRFDEMEDEGWAE